MLIVTRHDIVQHHAESPLVAPDRGQSGIHQGVPLHQALIRELEKHHLAGATVVRGVTGYGAHRSLHRKGLLEPHDEPLTLLVIENEGERRAALPTLRPMVAEGIFVMFDAEVIPLPL
jgi:uncharacterized protein